MLTYFKKTHSYSNKGKEKTVLGNKKASGLYSIHMYIFIDHVYYA